VSYAIFDKKKSAASAKSSSKAASSGLRIGRADDSLEQQADRMAAEVLSGGRAMQDWSLSSMPIDAPVQRKCQCGGSGGAAGECEECKKKHDSTLQRKADGAAEADIAPPIVDEVLNSPGQPLDKTTRDYFESKFGYDFSQVRVHVDAQAAQSANAVNARAYAVGNQMAFATGEYAPSTLQGRRLLAHELTHVLQQRPATPRATAVNELGAETRTHRKTPRETKSTRVRPIGHRGVQRQPNTGGVAAALDADDQKVIRAAQREAAKFQCNVDYVLWGILNKHFPDDTRKLAGTGCDSGIPGLRTEFSKVDPRDPRVTRSVPLVYAGKNFLVGTDAPHFKDRVAEMKAEIEKIDDWRLTNVLIDQQDLSNPRITGQLRSMAPIKLINYGEKTKDAQVKSYVENLRTFSTPTQDHSAVDPLSGNMLMQINGLNIVIKPDVSGAAGVKGGQTGQQLTMDPPNSPGFNFDRHGKVFGFPGYNPSLTLEIVTSYGPSATPEGTSGYGRGTTKEDVGNKATALRVHEGSHGEDYINFVRNNPFPVFGGTNGMTRKAFEAAQKAYWDAVHDWTKRIGRSSELATDCVGKTIDQYHKGEADYKNICP